MRYMLAHMLEGEVKEYHYTLSNDLAKRFRLRPVASRIAPHLTLKAPFDTEQPAHLGEIGSLLERFAAKENAQPFTLGGVGDFRQRVIYMDVEAPKQTHMFVRRMQDKLRDVSWLSFSPKEFPLELHATLCYPKNPQQGKEIRVYLEKQEIPSFECVLDHVALLKKENGVWEEVRRFSVPRRSAA